MVGGSGLVGPEFNDLLLAYKGENQGMIFYNMVNCHTMVDEAVPAAWILGTRREGGGVQGGNDRQARF